MSIRELYESYEFEYESELYQYVIDSHFTSGLPSQVRILLDEIKHEGSKESFIDYLFGANLPDSDFKEFCRRYLL